MSREMTVEDVIKIGDELRKQAIASASPDEISEQLRKQIMASASLDEISEHVRKQAISSAPPEDRLAGLAPEEMALLHEQIEVLLAKQSATQPHHRTSADKP